MNRKKTVLYAFRSSLPVMAGYVILGIGFGFLLSSKGYHWWWSLLMSVTIYAGSMQYAAIDLLTSGASLIAGALLTLMINIRHLFYGIAMLKEYSAAGKARPYLIFSLTDETFSLVCSPKLPEGVDKNRFYLLVSLFDQSYWVLGCTIGGILGNTLPVNAAGLDFAMTALFVVVFTEQWGDRKNHFSALVGLGISAACVVIFGPGNFIIPAMIGIAGTLLIARRWIGGGDHA